MTIDELQNNLINTIARVVPYRYGSGIINIIKDEIKYYKEHKEDENK